MLLKHFNSVLRGLNYKIGSSIKTLRCFATATKTIKENEDDPPVKFSKTDARLWKAESSRLNTKTPRLWYEPYVILTSLSVFLIYFTILREENDIDAELNRTLYTRIQGLEEQQLRVSLEYNREQGKDTVDIEMRLQELENDKIQNK